MTFDAPEPWRPEPVPAVGAPSSDAASADAAPAERLRLRPPVGIPRPASRRLPSVLLSVTLHALVVLLILAPLVAPSVIRQVSGAGETGPAGGGGGGARGTGGDDGGWDVRERLHMIQVAPPVAAPVAPAPAPPVVKPPVPPPPTPAVPPPPAVSTPTPAPAARPASAAGVSAPIPGTGGGTGADGTSGSGPGSGGGVGAGIGAGRGSGVGPGTGGGGGTNYAPAMIEMFIPPLPLPRKVAGSHVLAVFDVDSTGRIVSVDFTPTPDGGYNRKLREVFAAFRFRPGTRPDGTPVRAKVSFEYEL